MVRSARSRPSILPVPRNRPHVGRSVVDYARWMTPFGLLVAAGTVFAAACTEHGQSPTVSDGPGQAVCMQQFDDAVDRACVTAADCTVVSHDDCCGVVV